MASWHDRILLWRKFADQQQEPLDLLDAHTGLNKCQHEIVRQPDNGNSIVRYRGFNGGQWTHAAITYWLSGTFGRKHNRWILQPTPNMINAYTVGFKNPGDHIYMVTAWHSQAVCDFTTPGQRVLLMLGAMRMNDHHALKYDINKMSAFEQELKRQVVHYKIPH